MISHSTADPVRTGDPVHTETHRHLTETEVAPAKAHADLARRVRLFLNGSNLPGLRHIQIEINGDTVILRGAARTFYEKQLASRLSGRVAGVMRVIDLIEVRGYVPRVESDRSKRRVGENLARPA